MAGPEELAVVDRWRRAVAARDAAAASSVAADDIELGAPGGQGARQGIGQVAAWLGERLVVAQALHWFARGAEVVVAQLETWLPRDPERVLPRVAVQGAERYVVRGGRVCRVEHHPSLETALAAAGLDAGRDAVGDPSQRV